MHCRDPSIIGGIVGSDDTKVSAAAADVETKEETVYSKVSGLKKYGYQELSVATLGFNESRLMSADGAFGSVYHGTFGSS